MSQFRKHRDTKSKFREIMSHPEAYVTIHYSCESFYDTHGGHSARITSIAVYDIARQQTHSFALHTAAEEMGIALEDIDETKYNEIEHYMLRQYFDFIPECKNQKFIHWNMLDMQYGFFALEHRYKVLSNQFGNPQPPFRIPDTNKLNLADMLKDMYSPDYIGHKRMPNLIELNKIKPADFLSGADEAKAFEDKKFVQLSASTNSKVRVFVTIMDMAANGRLETKATWSQIHGTSPQALWDYLNAKWYTSLIMSGISLVIGAFLGAYVAKTWTV